MANIDANLAVNGRLMKEWKSISIRRSITQLADTFRLRYIDTIHLLDYPIKVGDKCLLSLGATPIVTGYVDVCEWSYKAGGAGSSTTHDFMVEGRSKTADLFDSSVGLDPTTWKNKTFLIIAAQVCKPFGIIPVLTANVDALVNAIIPRHSVEIGESAADCLGRLAQKLGVLLRTNATGQLEIGRPPTKLAKGAIALGNGAGRIKAGSRRSDHRDRHDLYLVFGQRQGSNTVRAEAARSGKQQATDKRVTRHRPLIWIQDGSSTAGTLQRAAEWTRNTRAGQSERVTYTVQGWDAAPGQLWAPGQTVIVNDKLLRVKKQGLIVESVNFTFERGSGSMTQIDLVRAEAFAGLTPPTPPKITDGVIAW